MRTVTLIALVAAACSSTAPDPAADAPAAHGSPIEAAAKKGPWAPAMRELEQQAKSLAHQLLDSPAPDLREVAAAAEAAAAIVREGYGRFEDRSVPGFAKMARDAESWLLQVGLEAHAGRAELARELLRGGDRAHCQRCHDATAKARG